MYARCDLSKGTVICAVMGWVLGYFVWKQNKVKPARSLTSK